MAAYLADVDAGEPLLAELVGPGQERVWKVFRYPFLWQGTDLPSRLALRQALVDRHYRIAEITIDFADWAYNAPYVRCLGQGDTSSVGALESMLLDSAIAELRWADDTLRRLAGRPGRTFCSSTPERSTPTSWTGCSPPTRGRGPVDSPGGGARGRRLPA